MISLIRRWWTEFQVVEKKLDSIFPGEEVTRCPRCHNLLRVRYTLKFMSHLRYDHGMPENEAIEMAVKVSERVYELRRAEVRQRRDV